MHTVRHNIEKNRLYLTLIGSINHSEVLKIKEEMFDSIEKLLPNFDVVNDLSRLVHGEEGLVPVMHEILKFEIEKKVNRIVRIVGQSKYGLIQFAKFTNTEEAKLVKYVPTLEEAENFLANADEKNTP